MPTSLRPLASKRPDLEQVVARASIILFQTKLQTGCLISGLACLRRHSALRSSASLTHTAVKFVSAIRCRFHFPTDPHMYQAT